jgi:hypothetical protein
MKFAIATLAAAAAGLAACAPTDYPPPGPPPGAPPPPGAAAMPAPGAGLGSGDCFRTADIRAHTVGDNRTLYLRVNRDEVYRVGMSGACLAGAITSDPLVIRQPPGSPVVCRPIDLDIGISRGGFSSTCIVESIARLTPPEVEALPPKVRP